MKKHDEGYVLAFVMVVIVVLCLVAVSLMSVSLRNLETQNASVERMQDKYAAQGMIEQVVAAIDSELTLVGRSLEDSLENYLGDAADVSSVTTSGATGEPGTITHFAAKLQIASKPENSSVKIDTTLTWEAAVEIDNETNTYKITTTKLTYDSYQISTVATGEEGAE